MNQEKNRSLMTGIVMMLVAFIFLGATGFSGNDMYYLSYLALAVMFVSGGVYVLKSLRKNPGTANDECNTGENPLSVYEWIGIIIFFAISLLMFSYIGFYVTLFLMFIVMHLFVSKRNNRFSMKKTLIFSLIGILCIYLVFCIVLKINFPSDVLLV